MGPVPTIAADYRNRKCMRTMLTNSAWAFWIFFISALYHAAINTLTLGSSNLQHELSFFLSSWALCCLESVVASVCGKKLRCNAEACSPYAKMMGYIWVFSYLLWLAPKWQYSLICVATGK
ncbi:hypothetical protein PFICI_09142 [Pestalotiopsis fici W106-1]|uniref:Uncharacterized protein n=1 Tax=Pestalotiopsis fici (strain W106-1 / CGMCC3.15140) TaxID=1229662 RepID=W3WZV1_PESFW|nr:uncharacterized protein PFICI_09142 [Pestalotiopsis fici W106-1]ETS79289.1 hypothetical protein PFICI_09142 [Pestalotiopsis fici W106-1]